MKKACEVAVKWWDGFVYAEGGGGGSIHVDAIQRAGYSGTAQYLSKYGTGGGVR